MFLIFFFQTFVGQWSYFQFYDLISALVLSTCQHLVISLGFIIWVVHHNPGHSSFRDLLLCGIHHICEQDIRVLFLPPPQQSSLGAAVKCQGVLDVVGKRVPFSCIHPQSHIASVKLSVSCLLNCGHFGIILALKCNLGYLVVSWTLPAAYL